jgi:response regulator RpfG family c-di-GMP phosphodiesterase
MNTTAERSKPTILFVDDEARLLEGLALLLRRDYDVHVATSGMDALQKLTQLKNVAVVVSDFRMPQMDGATFLHEVMQRAPQATRILLTGEAGLEGAKDAVNKGQIFRFLTKPCPSDQLRNALDAGIEHHRLLNAERNVMLETLLECISALMEVLAVTNPVAFGRAQRLKSLVADIAKQLGLGQFWQLEAAALLSQIGYFAESPALAEKIYYGRPLTTAEHERAKAVSSTAAKLLEHIPRLEPVIQILAALDWPDASVARLGDGTIGLGTRILCLALEYDALAMQELPKTQILQKLKERESRVGAKVLAALSAHIGLLVESEPELVMPLRNAKPGMRLRQEIRSQVGALLVPFGFEVSERLLERLSQVAPETLEQNVRLATPPAN